MGFCIIWKFRTRWNNGPHACANHSPGNLAHLSTIGWEPVTSWKYYKVRCNIVFLEPGTDGSLTMVEIDLARNKSFLITKPGLSSNLRVSQITNRQASWLKWNYQERFCQIFYIFSKNPKVMKPKKNLKVARRLLPCLLRDSSGPALQSSSCPA